MKSSSRSHYFNTFGGNPVSAAAGLAVLDEIEENELQQNALAVGQFILDGLHDLATRHDCIGDVRGTGFFLAVELVEDRETRNPDKDLAHRVVNDLREHGVLTGSIGPDNNILKLRPPMVLSVADANVLIETLDGSISRTA